MPSKCLAVSFQSFQKICKTLLLSWRALWQTSPRSNDFFNSDFSDLTPICRDNNIPYRYVLDVNSKDNIEPAGIPSQTENGLGAVFLLDSGSTGETGPMVNIFMENMKQEGFRQMLKEQFVKHTDACVDDFLKGDVKSLFSNVKRLSHFL